MLKRRPGCGAIAVGIAIALAGRAVLAQESTPATTEIEMIVVTGSFIRGAAEDAALPIQVLTADDLQKQGSPTMLELAKALPASQGVFGDSNQFTAGQSTGSANVNLRGLGALRSLVMLNGRRLAPNPATGAGIDINLLPSAAIGRIEVLKDGAAATYGSDAVAGVVNFITREDFEGLQIDGSYSYIDGSDGDYGTNLAYGWKGESNSLLLTAGYRVRSELPARERGWALRPLDENPQGGWSGSGSPGTYIAGATRFVDPQCENLGGVFTGTGPDGRTGAPVSAAAATGCAFQYLGFDNLVEDEEHYQFFAQLDQDIGESTSLHFEALYAAHNVEAENSSPSYAPNQGASGGAPNYFIPAANPGFADLLPQLTLAQRAAITSAGGAVANALLWRPLGVGGNPLTGEGKEDQRNFDGYRFSLGLQGSAGETISWDTAVTYGVTRADISTPDMLVARLGRALAGFGGASCTGTVAGQNGCLWFNPFSTGVAANLVTGQQNPRGATALNSLEVIDWLFEDYAYELEQSVLTVDGVLAGEAGLGLPGGNIGWALGAQYRRNGYLRDANDFSDPAVTPCPQTPLNPAATCTIQSGAFSFFGPLSHYDLKQDVYSAYAELNLPLRDSLNAQVAVRHEDYGGGIGDTTNPKLALRWQPFDALVVRGSVSTTFRAPSATQTVPGFLATASAFTTQAGTYKPYDTYGNPELQPEQALAFNVGMIVKLAGFTGSLDYWSFDIEDEIATDSGTAMVRAFYDPTFDPATFATRCIDPAYAGLRSRFTFTGTGCGSAAAPNQPAIANLVRTRIQPDNSATKAKVSGIDASLQYSFEGVGPGELSIGADGTYNLEYEQGATLTEGIELLPAGDYVGTRGTAGSLPKWKASGFVDYAFGAHNLRWTARYLSDMEDTRTGQSLNTFAGIRPGDPGSVVGSTLTHDVTYRAQLPGQSMLNFSVLNVLDEDPSFARLDLSYDPFTGSPVGRAFKLGLSKTF
jgi:iron complex outermembrane recepter protein